MHPVVLSDRLKFPDPRRVTAPAPGLVAIGGDLSVERLLLAYRSGIFPWSAQPITWWSLDPRAIFEFDQFHIPRSVATILKRSIVVEQSPGGASAGAAAAPGQAMAAVRPKSFDITFDRAFRAVMEGCATDREDGAWITPPIIEAYTRLHEIGAAHSVECWHNGQLAGGVYGVTVGGLFAGESMFHRVSNASKVALCFLVERLQQRGFTLFDIQMVTPVTLHLGARMISRDQYLKRLARATRLTVTF